MELKDLNNYSSKFYEDVYKDLYKNELYNKQDQKLYFLVDTITNMPKSNNQTYIKQLEFYPLAVEFLKVTYNSFTLEDLAKKIDVSNEFFYIWYESFNKGNIITPVNFKKETIDKIAEIVLQDRCMFYIQKNNIQEKDLKTDLIVEEVIKEMKSLYEPKKNKNSNKLSV